MKITFALFIVLLLSGCSRQQKGDIKSRKIGVLENRIDSLERVLADAYKPGFGEIMSRIQAHHAKLWFAGINENWPLADFEVHEIREGIDNIEKYQHAREESALVGMINPALDSVLLAVENKSLHAFERSYTLLTNRCNECHKDTKFEFNIVKIPAAQTFSNQEF